MRISDWSSDVCSSDLPGGGDSARIQSLSSSARLTTTGRSFCGLGLSNSRSASARAENLFALASVVGRAPGALQTLAVRLVPIGGHFFGLSYSHPRSTRTPSTEGGRVGEGWGRRGEYRGGR